MDNIDSCSFSLPDTTFYLCNGIDDKPQQSFGSESKLISPIPIVIQDANRDLLPAQTVLAWSCGTRLKQIPVRIFNRESNSCQ